jgi:hypothetical protein
MKNNMILDVLEIEDFLIVKKFEKIVVPSDEKKSMKKWIKSEDKKTKIVMPNLSSSLVVKEKNNFFEVNSLGYFYNHKNSIKGNSEGVSLFTSPFSDGHGQNIHFENFLKISSSFAARRCIIGNFINWEDNYFAPNEEDKQYQQFTCDSIVYSLFNSKSNQSSLRQVTYKNKLWDIKNEFFWISKNEMLDKANKNNYTELYNDARTDSDRYVYKLLFGEERIYDKLSPDAKLVLDKATELVRKSMEMREIFANDENHLKSWDAGYAQLKLLWKEYYSDEFNQFRQLYKNLEDRMRPLVYELGFLMK